jgi:aryl-alcohol dehydrogenase-like predicted oxidoreductase/histidinol phosphatase-like enzyme/predicted kinase
VNVVMIHSVALGTMRLSTDAERDDDRSVAVLHAAFDAGITLVDTADAYCRDASEVGHNERVIARAIASWSGDRSTIRVATKGGLTRPEGRWVPDGRGKHLTAACAASRRALGVERIHLYQLHAPDPRTPLATSVRALAALQRDGAIESIGLSNVTVGQIEEASAIADIAAVQVELSVWKDDNILNGVVDYCIANRIQLLAYRPLGGPERARKLAANPALAEIAAKHGVTAGDVALAWLMNLSELIVPVVGVTRVETARSMTRAAAIVLDADDKSRSPLTRPKGARRFDRLAATPHPRDGEVVLIMGLPGAGKSTMAQAFVAQGYARLNRDTTGGSLTDLLPALDQLITSGTTRIVLDNTYLSRAARARVIAAASERGLPVRCLSLDTTIEDAQVNAVQRMLDKLGRLPDPDEIRRASKRDPTIFGPSVQFRCQRELEPPHPSEGFATIESVTFERRRDPTVVNKGVVFWVDGVLTQSRSGARAPTSADDVQVLPGRAEVLQRFAADGWRLLGLSWQPEITDKTTSVEDVEAAFTRTQELLGVQIEIAYCPHPAGPPICWCRKPLPGLGVVFINRYQLDPAACLYVGGGAQDPGFARRLGFQFRPADEFFAAL